MMASNIFLGVLIVLVVSGLQAGAEVSMPPFPAGPGDRSNSGGGGGTWKGGAGIPSAGAPSSSIVAKFSPVGIPLLTSWMKYLSDSFKMGDRYKMVEVLQRTPSEMILQWKRRRTGGGSKATEKIATATKASMPFSYTNRPRQAPSESSELASPSSASAAAHLLLDSAESVFHHVGDGTVTQEDIEALEDFGLQAASFTIVVVVAAMFGAFLSWVFRIAYIKWRRRLVASLPIVRYTGPGWEAVPVAPASRFNTSALPAPHPSSSSSLGAADYSEEEERLVLLRSAVEQSLAQLAHAVTSAADPQVSAFLAYLSTNATHVFDELQSLSHHAVDIVNTVLHREGCRVSASTSSSLSASSAALLLLQWDLRRLVAAAGIITSEFEAFLASSSWPSQRSGVRNSRRASSDGELRGRSMRESSKTLEAPRLEFSAVLSRLRQSLVQYRNELVVVAEDRTERAQGAEGLELPDHGVHIRRPCDDQVGAAFCPVCLDKFVKGETLSQLPCRHLYHTRCIVPWLMKQSLTCPLCKQIGI